MSVRHWVQLRLRNNGLQVERARDPFLDQSLLLGGQAQVIFDGGANEGQTTTTYLKLFPTAKIYCFEPSPTLYARLSANCKGDNIFPVQLALSDQKETVSFFEYNITGYNSFEKCTVDGVNTAAEIRVETTKIDDFCATNGIETIDILKLDIQGAEVKALRGAMRMLTERRIRLVFAEVHFAAIYERQCFYQEIATLLENFDLPLFRFYDLRYTKQRRLEYADAIFCAASLNYEQ